MSRTETSFDRPRPETIPFLAVGAPADWREYEVVDDDTGNPLQHVLWADAQLGVAAIGCVASAGAAGRYMRADDGSIARFMHTANLTIRRRHPETVG